MSLLHPGHASRLDLSALTFASPSSSLPSNFLSDHTTLPFAMTFSESPIPGAFTLDGPLPTKLDLAGVASQFYQPPQTPSAASSLCHSVSSNQGSRKRARFGYGDTDTHIGSLDDFISWGNDSTSLSGLASPVPLVNTDYRFAGGLDTPTAASAASLERCEYDGNGPEVDYRPNRYRDSRQSFTESCASQTIIPREGNRKKRDRRVSFLWAAESGDGNKQSNGWGKAVVSMVGDVAGKVWDFCWTSAFHGFYAGGGKGYQMDAPSTPSLDQSVWQTVTEREDGFSGSRREETPVPGRFPVDDDTPPPPPDRDELRANWVLVRNEQPSREGSPSHSARKVPRKSICVHPVTPRRMVAARPGRRPSLIPARPSPSHHLHSPHIASGSPKAGSASKTTDSPVAIEAQRYAAKARRREREEDASIRRLNQQLKAMIKEGKEALGSRVEVDDVMDLDDFD